MSRLTEEMVIARSKQSDLSTIRKLNCWGSELSDVSIIRRMLGVELLALSVNRVSTLADFENCVKLQELYLRKNNIQDINDLVYLQQLPNLRHLWLEENPCVEKAGPNYRQIVLRALPNLQKLDNIDVTPEELAEAMRGAALQEDDAYEDTYNDHGSQQNLSPAQHQQHHPQQHQQQQQPLQQSPPSPQQQPPQANYQQQTQYSQQQTSPQQMYNQQPQHNQRQQQPEQQAPPPSQQQQQQHQWRPNSPTRETGPVLGSQASPDITEDSISESNERGSMPTSPQQTTSPNQEYSPAEPKFNRDQHRHSYHQPSYDRSPGSDHGSPMMGYRERRAMAPSMSMHSMKDYYQSDRPTPPFYRHSQTDLTEWEEEHNQQNKPPQPTGNHPSSSSSSHHNQQQQPHSRQSYGGHSHQIGNNSGPSSQHRRSIGPGEQREPYTNGGGAGGGYGGGGCSGVRNGSAASLHNGSKDKDDWEEVTGDRGRRGDGRPRRPESRFNDNTSVMSSAVINHYASFHRRPVNRSSNLLSAALCLVKELDYPSLEVIEQVVRCRIDELSAD